MAARYESRGDAPTITRRRHVLACARCRARRVKCDKLQPTCSNCAKAGALCQPAQQSAPPQVSLPTRSGHRDPVEQDRLVKLEEEVARLSREVDSKSPSRERSLSPSALETIEARPLRNQGKLVFEPDTRYLSPSSWAVVADKVADVEGMLQTDTAESGRLGASMSSASSPEEQAPFLPDEHLHNTLTTIYHHRVDPLIRLLHWPSFSERSRAFRNSRQAQIPAPGTAAFSGAYYPGPLPFDPNRQNIYTDPPIVPARSPQPRSFPPSFTASTDMDLSLLALLYAVYHAALVAVLEGPNPSELGPDINTIGLASTLKRELSNRVLSINKNVTRRVSLETLQALVLTLAVDSDPSDLQLQWLQLGAAIRMARGLGLHRDGSNFDLKPIDIEIRRRTWAQICILDVQFAERLCCEPTITSDSYDTALPLSVSDADLTAIHEQTVTSQQGQERHSKTYVDIEQSQEHYSPYSAMSFCLVGAEAARLSQRLFVPWYCAKDSLLNLGGSTPRVSRRGAFSGVRDDKTQWAVRLEHHFQSVYGVNDLEHSDVMQHLVAELIEITIARAKLITGLSDWRENGSDVGESVTDTKLVGFFHDAIYIATRCLTLIHQYSNTSFRWYMKRFIDPYVCSFIGFCLVSGQPINESDITTAWSLIDQLYPVDSTGIYIEQNMAQSLLGKVLSTARLRRDLQLRVGNTGGLRDRAMHAATGVRYAPTTPTTNFAGVATFQPTGNLFEDFDAMMHDSMWSAGMSGTEGAFNTWEKHPHQ